MANILLDGLDAPSTKSTNILLDGLDLPPVTPERNAFAVANDTAIGIANSAAGMVKSGIDLVAPGSRASKAIEGFIKQGEGNQSDFKKAERTRLSADIQSADGELGKVGAYLGAVKRDPGMVVEQAVGNIGPLRALGLAFQAAGWGTKSMMVAAGALSAGEVRGNILDKVLGKKDAELAKENSEYASLRNAGMTEEEAKKEIGTRVVQHLPELAATALVGSLGGKYGLEGIASGLGKPVKNRLVAAGVSTLDEAAQGGVEQVATNVGVRRIDGKQSLTEDVLLNAVQEGLPGGLGGAVAYRRQPEETGTTPPSASDIINQTGGFKQDQQLPSGNEQKPSSELTAFASSAFADVMGDDGVSGQQQQARGVMALSLSQIASLDGEQGLAQAIQTLSGGDAALAERLYEASQDQELVSVGRQALDSNTMGFVELNDAIRSSAGLVESEAQPQAPQAMSPERLAAGVQAVRDGLINGAILDEATAQTVDINGLEQGIATGPDGRQAVVVGRDAAAVQQAVAMAAQVGLEQAQEALQQPAQGKAFVTSTDGVASTMTPQEAATAPGSVAGIRTVQEELMDRLSKLPPEQPASAPEPSGQMSLFARKAPERVAEPFSPAEQTGSAAQFVENINSELGLTGDEAISPTSLTEVRPKNKALTKLAAGIKTAFGVNVVYVHAPKGLVRNNGKQFNSFAGIADRRTNTIYVSVDTNITLNVFGHELAHILETQHPDIYSKLELVVLSRMRANAARALRDRLQAAMKKESGASDTDIAREFRREVVAEAIGEMAQDQSLWTELFSAIGTKGTPAKTLYDKVLELIAKIQRALTSAGYMTGVKDVAQVKKAITAAYKDWADRYEYTGENPANLTEEESQALAETQKLAEEKPKEPPKKAAPKEEPKKEPPKVESKPEAVESPPVSSRAAQDDLVSLRKRESVLRQLKVCLTA